jgi:hypothetical protein
MTFVEELKQLSEKVELRHKIERQFLALKAKMKTAASNGYRCFKIEIFTLITDVGAIYLQENKNENYYCFYTHDGAFYASALDSFLDELGFDSTSCKFVHDSSNVLKGYTSLIAVVEW